MGNIPRTRIGWYGLVYNIIFCLVEISLESHILVDGKLPIGNSNRELQGSRVYFCIIIVYPLTAVSTYRVLATMLPLSVPSPPVIVVFACFLLIVMG